MSNDTVTAKQAAATVRKTLDMLASGVVGQPTRRISNSDGSVSVEVPAGLDFLVRATKSGVNIIIEDRGWVDRVTGGDRATIRDHKSTRDEICAEVDKIRGMFTPALPGKTEWAPIFISARMTGVTHISPRAQ